MPDLARQFDRSTTRVLLVRRPVKSVRPREPWEQLPVRLAIGTLGVAGGLLLVWLVGYAGRHLGFLALLGVPELGASAPADFAAGLRVLLALPRRVVQAGIADPLWLMLAFAMIALPAGAHAAIRPRTPGGPRPTGAYVAFAFLGASLTIAAAGLILAWTVAPTRLERIAPLPSRLDLIEDWLTALHVAAGVDAIVCLAAAVWLVLAFRLPVPAWMKSITIASIALAALLALLAAAATNGAAALLDAPRARGTIQTAPGSFLLLGSTPHHTLTLAAEGERPVLAMFDLPIRFEIRGRASIAAFLLEAAAPPEEQRPEPALDPVDF